MHMTFSYFFRFSAAILLVLGALGCGGKKDEKKEDDKKSDKKDDDKKDGTPDTWENVTQAQVDFDNKLLDILDEIKDQNTADAAAKKLRPLVQEQKQLAARRAKLKQDDEEDKRLEAKFKDKHREISARQEAHRKDTRPKYKEVDQVVTEIEKAWR